MLEACLCVLKMKHNQAYKSTTKVSIKLNELPNKKGHKKKKITI